MRLRVQDMFDVENMEGVFYYLENCFNGMYSKHNLHDIRTHTKNVLDPPMESIHFPTQKLFTGKEKQME